MIFVYNLSDTIPELIRGFDCSSLGNEVLWSSLVVYKASELIIFFFSEDFLLFFQSPV